MTATLLDAEGRATGGDGIEFSLASDLVSATALTANACELLAGSTSGTATLSAVAHTASGTLSAEISIAVDD